MAVTVRRGIFERDKGSGIWWIRYTDQNGKRHREKVGSYGAAEKLLDKRHTEVLEDRKLPELSRSRSVVTFGDLCDDALAHSTAENSPKQTYELGTRINVLKPIFGSRPADSIRKSEVVNWLANEADVREWKPASRNRWQATFSLIFRVGIDNERIDKNPAARIRRKTEGNGRVRFLSDAEEKRLFAAIDKLFPEFRPHVQLAIHTGLRLTEQYSLRWNQVDLERRQIHLPKTKNGDARVIRLNSVAVEALEALRPVRTGPVFPSVRTGDSLQGPRGWFPAALEKARIDEFSWHCLRHTFGSKLVMAGVDLRTVAELLGHRTLQMVMRYSHLAPEHQVDAVDRLVPKTGNRTATKTATSGFRGKRKIGKRS
jgi:integrase